MALPSISNYGQYSNSNYGAHTLRVTVGALTVYFSYQTPVAFSTWKDGLVCSENRWGPTTGKHLNWIEPDRSRRIPRAEFEARLADVMAQFAGEKIEVSI